ncbi:MAG: cyclodeaminase/cyclohydrolase family protein [Acutalibacteraceae bacterium]
MVESMSIQEFLDVLSSKEPVPGGGGAALAGALGNALGQMVANLTIGKKKYALVEDEIKGTGRRMKGIQGQFTALADQGCKVFAPLAKCYSLPSGTEGRKGIQGRGHGSTAVGCQSCANGNHGKAWKCWKSWISLRIREAGWLSAMWAWESVHPHRAVGAVMNVYINTKSMKNREKAEEMNEKAERLIKEGTEAADRIYQKVLEQLR